MAYETNVGEISRINRHADRGGVQTDDFVPGLKRNPDTKPATVTPNYQYDIVNEGPANEALSQKDRVEVATAAGSMTLNKSGVTISASIQRERL